MRNMLALFGFLVLVGLGVGWYQNWFQVSRTPGDSGDIQVNVNAKNVEQGVQKGVEWVGNTVTEIGKRVAEKAKEETHSNQSPDSVASPTPNSPFPKR